MLVYYGRCCDEGRSYIHDYPNSPSTIALQSLSKQIQDHCRLYSNALLKDGTDPGHT